MTDTKNKLIFQEALASDLSGIIIDMEYNRVISIVVASTGEVKLSLTLEVLVDVFPKLQALINIAQQVPRTDFLTEQEQIDALINEPDFRDRAEFKALVRAEAERLLSESIASKPVTLEQTVVTSEDDPGIDNGPGADGWG